MAPGKPGMGGKRLLLGLAVSAAAVTAGIAWHGARADAAASSAESAEASEIKLVKTVRVNPAPEVDARVAVGDIRPRHESDLGFRISGKLIARGVDVGATVRKGDVIARIEDQDYRNRLRSAEADVAAAEAVLVEAAAAEKRIGTLLSKGYSTRANYDATLKNLRSAQAKMQSADVSYEMASDQLGYTELRAEFDGVVTAVGAEPGQLVNVGQMVVRLADPAERDAVFAIAEAAFGRQDRPGSMPDIVVSLLSNPAIRVAGHVREIAPIADAATGTFQVKVALDDAPDEMRFGAAVSGRADAPASPVATLPGSALFDKDGKPAVWIVGTSSTVTLKPVAVARYEADRVIVSGGLAAGDIVVTAGVNRLREHQKVRFDSGEQK